ncbi:MAG: low-specificity L-threonine aldolase [Anaerolineales bacterium]
MELVDLRSDTVTKPTPEMRQAMANAEVGDDVYGDDPTVNRLQEMAADLMGKEAGLFVPSGTMGNLAAILAHCRRGDEVIIGDKNHSFVFEAGGLSAAGGVHSHQVPNQGDGSLRLEDVEAAIRPDDPHFPVSRLVCLENTHNRCGGTVQSVEYTNQVSALAHSHHLGVHLDGARIFNAAAALHVDASELARPADSVTFCLSKGLCAPVGSVLCGSKDFIHWAHRARKMLGGGMRQAGILAAAGLVALTRMVARLEEDHVRARRLAKGLANIRGLQLDPGTPATNMVFFNLGPEIRPSADQVVQLLRQAGILTAASGPRRFRFVTHYWVDDEAVDRTVAAMARAVA